MEMKRNSIIAAAVCLAALASCQKQEIVESPSLAKVDVELTASSDLNSTKTVMTEYNNHWWSVSDKISLFYKVDGTSTVRHSVFTSKNLIPSATARFAGTLSLPAEDTDLKTVSAIAVYPTAAEGASSDGTSVTVTVPAVQTAVEGTFMEGAYPVVAQTSDLTAALSFKAVCGGVKVPFQTPGITSFTFDGKDSKIAGTASVTFDTDGNPVATTDESAVSVITVNAPADGFEVGKWYYMTALPATLDGGYTITLSNGKSFGSTSSIAIKRSVFGVLDAKDVETITYAPLADKLKPISWWDENKGTILDPKPAYTGTDREYDRTQANKNDNMIITSVKFISDASYVYGYFEGTGTDISRLRNLGLWLDVDGNQKGEQGGGWLFALYKYFDKIARGSIGTDGNMEWNPSLYESPKGSAWFGSKVATPSQVAYGAGSYENSVFKYSVIIDRRVLGLRNSTSMVIGLNFDDNKSTGIGNFTNPDRGGYVVPLKNADSDQPSFISLLKDFDYWTAVTEPTYTKDGYDKGKSVVKFDSDASYVYGYFEVNTDKLIYPEGDFLRLHPGILANLAIGIDTDGIKTEQGPGWMFSNKGYDVVLNGKASSYTVTDKKGWDYAEWGGCASTITVDGVTTKYKDFGEKLPDYTITPSAWMPKVYDMTTKADNWGKTVLAGTEGVDDIATGKGEWNSETKTFRYSFMLNREKLGIYGKDELEIGVAFNFNYTGFVCIPSRAGFTIKLNNN